MPTPDINRILAQPEHQRGSRYGAPMGKRDSLADAQPKLYLQRVHFIDGDYASDGTYWGGGRNTKPLYCAFTPDLSTEIYVRALCRDAAKEKVFESYADVAFVR